MTDSNITPLRPKDRTATERKRRSRANKRKRRVTPVTVATATLPTVTGHNATAAEQKSQAVDIAAYTVAVGLAGAAAWFSVRGMTVLFPGSPVAIIGMTVTMEAAKLVTTGWLSRRWRVTAWTWRLVLMALVVGLALINAGGVYAQLVAAHVGDRGAAQSAIDTQNAALAARIDVQAHTVADLDRRPAQIDGAIEKATEKGRTAVAMRLADDQKKARADLADERKREAGLWQHSRPNAPQWPLKAGKSRPRPRPFATSPSCSASTPTRRRFGG
jgi:hypothetical protein